MPRVGQLLKGGFDVHMITRRRDVCFGLYVHENYMRRIFMKNYVVAWVCGVCFAACLGKYV